MEFNLHQALSQAKQFSELASTLRNNKNSIISLKNSLDHNWKGTEMVHMDHAVATMANDLSKIASQLEALSNDISAAASEINREIAEEKAAAAKAEAAANASKALTLE